jgi:hypothetical protein
MRWLVGFKIRIEIGPKKFRGASKRMVWCHDEECAVQTLAVSRYGVASHRWPITLAQFRSLPEVKELIRRSACYEIPSQGVDSTSPKNGKSQELTSDAQNQFRNAENPVKRKGRPKQYASAASRQRAYRDRTRNQESAAA